MKKILFVALFIAGFASTTSAQQRHGYSQTTYIIEEEQPKERKKLKPVEPGYQSTVGVSFTRGGGDGAGVLLFEYIGGYRFNNTVFLGGGIGLGFSLGHPRLETKSHEYQYYYGQDELCPICSEGEGFAYRLFVNGRFYLSKTRLQPFLGAAIGFEGYKTLNDIWREYRCEEDQYHKDGHKA
uniref:hypothetical protein n=1 Tax=Alistipes sp. TaxID=1872444 RepID=UPI0040579AC8